MTRTILALLAAAAASIFYASFAYSRSDAGATESANRPDSGFVFVELGKNQAPASTSTTASEGCVGQYCLFANSAQLGSNVADMDPQALASLDLLSTTANSNSFELFDAPPDFLNTMLAPGTPETSAAGLMPTGIVFEREPADAVVTPTTRQTQLRRNGDFVAPIGNAGSVTPVPEPNISALILMGFGVLGYLARRRTPA